jgi:hypothetical protein
VLRFLRRTSDLPGRLEESIRSRPFATTTAIAGVAFVAGTIAGSRLARAVVVAAVPILVQRLLEGPLGDDLVGYVKKVVRTPTPRSAS